jgi:hypothetical protein
MEKPVMTNIKTPSLTNVVAAYTEKNFPDYLSTDSKPLRNGWL